MVKGVRGPIAPMEIDEHHKRADLAMLRTAVIRGFDVPPDAVKRVGAWAFAAMNDDSIEDGRVRAQAAKLLLELAKHNLNVYVELDRINRLDDGTSTENQSVKVEFVNRITPSES